MSVLHLKAVRAVLEKLFTGKIDLSDLGNQTEEQKQPAFFSRALAAFALMQLAEIDVDQAAAAVTDGTNDDGLDAVLWDEAEEILYLIQAKWDDAGQKTLEAGDAHKFIQGFKHLVDGDFSNANPRLKRHESAVMGAIQNARVKIQMVVVHTGNQSLNEQHVQPLFDQLLREVNDTSEILSLVILTQKELYSAVGNVTSGAPINLGDVALKDWGKVDAPFVAFYGQVEASDIAKWWEAHGPRLFSKNLRKFIGRTDVNAGIEETLSSKPDYFWYFNNGITALAQRFEKKPIGGTSRDTGMFECDGVSIVNGAQTVGTIGALSKKNPDLVKNAKVNIRFISLGNCPPEFATEVTRATNTQNRIELRDFVSLDPEQSRIRHELWAKGKDYVFKTGDSKPPADSGLDLEEATIALACANRDISLSIQAKAGIGRLWDDIAKPPYKTLFNAGIPGNRIWHLVGIMRSVEDSLKKLSLKEQGKKKAIAIHGNRFVLHHVYKGLDLAQLDSDAFDLDAARSLAIGLTKTILDKTADDLQKKYPAAYIQTLFKNKTKVSSLLS